MAIKANIVIDQGSSFETVIEISDENDVPIDVANSSFTAVARKHYTSSTVYNFNVTVVDTSSIKIAMTSSATALIPAGRYLYDCESTDPEGNVVRLVEGIVTITPRVGRT